MGSPNWKNQTIWTGDNLDIMRGMNSESVDLIYLDPPFNSKHDYAAPVGSKAAGAAFKDTWGLNDVNLAWHGEIKHEHPGLYDLLNATRRIHGDSMMSYLIYMAVRIIEMRRLLKLTGSIYIHCDPTASHYLKLLMDSVFGKQYYRSEIVWRRSAGHNKLSSQYGPIHDVIFFYTCGKRFAFHPGRTPYTRAYLEDYFRREDERGRYRMNELTGPGTRDGMSGEPWRDYNPTSKGRHWAIPAALRESLPEDQQQLKPHELLEIFDATDDVVFSKSGVPRYKQRQGGGVLYQDIWAYQPGTKGVLSDGEAEIDQDVKWLDSEPERVGYPTQKPIGLLERIVRSSAGPGDVVLDPFCGCATACIAAQKLGCEWVGIDISSKAADLVRSRMQDELGMFYNGTHRTDIPQRTDLGEVSKYNSPENKKYLYGEQGGYCNGCEHHFEIRNLHVDHILPKAKAGTDHISNLQLLCGACNSLKGTKTHEELLVLLTDKGWIKRKKEGARSA